MKRFRQVPRGRIKLLQNGLCFDIHNELVRPRHWPQSQEIPGRWPTFQDISTFT
jgi:hypothetical protein